MSQIQKNLNVSSGSLDSTDSISELRPIIKYQTKILPKKKLLDKPRYYFATMNFETNDVSEIISKKKEYLNGSNRKDEVSVISAKSSFP